ncbi:hypothetical protein [Microcystis aeruginosa]|uniref:Transposase n=1 Tax=Microcystis aeruginosa (strain NIES-843 / IAM M-2473) TaxID=449447 RepID=B0JKR6_MICAN|nr:hypothetical protein [Microcystis aeruginosa]BAG02855.1 unknown protein [Microcystis aeruginosa NIES-843]
MQVKRRLAYHLHGLLREEKKKSRLKSELPPYIYTIIAENPYLSMDTPINFS